MPSGSFQKYWVGFKGEVTEKDAPGSKEEAFGGRGQKKSYGNWAWSDATKVNPTTEGKEYAAWHKDGTKIKGACGLVMFNKGLNAVDCKWKGNFLCEYLV